MQLSNVELIDYLSERRLLDRSAVVDGDVTVADVTRRNRNRRVEVAGGRGLFVKQAGEDDVRKRESLVREAVAYELSAPGGALDGLRAISPRYLGFDERSALLVLELLDTHTSLGDELRGTGTVRPEVAAACGDALAVAARSGHGAAVMGTAPELPRNLPWPLVFHRTPPVTGTEGSAAQAQLLATVRADASHAAALAEIAGLWRFDALVHGDLKWDNCVVAEGGTRALLLDWELADLGDAAWDLGCLLQANLAHVLAATAVLGLEHLARGQATPAVVAHLAPTNRALLAGYANTAGLDAGRAADLRARALRYAAARLVQSAYELATGQVVVSPQAAAAVGCARAFALDPSLAPRLLLGESH